MLDTLERRVEDDVRLARITLELEQEKIVSAHADGREIDRHVLAALGTTHLLLYAADDLLEGVGVHFHHSYSTTEVSEKEYFLEELVLEPS